MPRVPVYDQQVRQASTPDARVNVHATPDDFGADVGQGLGQLAGGLERRAQIEKVAEQEHDTAQVLSATATMNQWSDLAISDPQQGALYARQGEGARGITDEYGKAFAEAAKATREGLANDKQRLAFDRSMEAKREVINHQLAAHEGQQNEEVLKGSRVAIFTSAASNASNAVAAAPLDAPATKKALELSRRQVMDATGTEAFVKRYGDPDDPSTEAGRQRGAQLTALHMGVLDRLTDAPGGSRGAEAKAYLDRYRPEIDGVVLGSKNVEKVIEAAGLADRARTEEARIWTEAKGDPVAAKAALRAIKDTALANAVEPVQQRRVSDDHAIRVAADSPRVASLESAIIAGRFSPLDKDYVLLSKEGKAVVDKAAMTHRGSQRSASAEDRRAATEERRRQAEVDENAVKTFTNTMSAGEQAAANVDALYADLPLDQRPTRNAILAVKGEQRKAQAIAAKGLSPKQDQVKAEVGAFAQTLYSNDPNGKAKAAKLQGEVMSWWMTELAKTNGELPTRAQVNEHLAGEILYVKAPHWYGDSTKTKIQAEAMGEGYTTIPEAQQPPNVKAALAKLRAAPAAPAPAAPSAAAPSPAPKPAVPAGKVRITGPGGKSGVVPEAGLDAWLASPKGKGWSRGG